METKKRCAKCGKRLKKGGAAYRLKAELISDFDGYLPMTNKDLSQQLIDIEDLVQGKDEKELMEQVYIKFDHLLCQECRDKLESHLRPEVSE